MTQDRLQLSTPLDLPVFPGSTRVAVGANELVFEAVRGGHVVLWHAGREARRFVLGLASDGELLLELRPPRYPVKVLLRETVALAPRARVNGFVQVPLVPTLLWLDTASGRSSTLLDLTPPSLAAEWEGDRPNHCAESSWLVRFPVHGGEARVTVPLRLRNVSTEPVSPEHVLLPLDARDLVELRGGIVTRPRRLLWDGASWQAVAASASEVQV